MLDHIRAGSGLLKRAAEGGYTHYDFPPWAIVVIVLTVLAFIPGVITVGTPFHATDRPAHPLTVSPCRSATR